MAIINHGPIMFVTLLLLILLAIGANTITEIVNLTEIGGKVECRPDKSQGNKPVFSSSTGRKALFS